MKAVVFASALFGIAAVAGLGLALQSCAGITSPASNGTAFVAVAYTCASSTAALKTAILYNAKLTPANRVNVTAAGEVLNPICSQDPVPTVSTTTKALLDAALAKLTAAAAQAQQEPQR